MTTASLAANATISAQETTPGQDASNCALALSITSYPLTPWCGDAVFSGFWVLLISIEPSHPWKIPSKSCHKMLEPKQIKTKPYI